MKKKKALEIPEETKTRIVERWRHNKANSLTIIADEFDCSYHQVNAIINKYLSTKILP
jgi:hypothetical protein